MEKLAHLNCLATRISACVGAALTVAVLGCVLAGGCGATAAVGPEAQHDPCAPLFSHARPPHGNDSEYLAAVSALEEGRLSDALVHGEAFVASLEAETVRTFHSGPVSATERRDFFDRWVFVEPGVLQVQDDRFVFDQALALVFVDAALRAGDVDAAELWAERSGSHEGRAGWDRCLAARRAELR